MGRVKRIWYLSPMRAANVQASLRIRAVSPEPPLLAHTSSESRGTFRQKARSLVPMNGWACAVKICHDGMLEDTNSLDAAQIMKKINLQWTNRTDHKAHLDSSHSHSLGGSPDTTDDVATIPFHPSLSSATFKKSPNPIPVHSLMLSCHLFLCLSLLLAPGTVPFRIVFAMPEDLEMWPYHLSFRFLTMIRRLSCTPIAFWILLRTPSFVTWSL